MATFSGVPDTLFIPLTARIYISKHFPDYVYDGKALELEEKIPASCFVKNNQCQHFANVSCFYNMDRIVKAFIEEHGACNIVNLGCGFETNYWRIHDERATFYELDLEEVIDKRKMVLGESERDILLPYSMFDRTWTKHIDQTKPSLLTARGVFEYFKNEDIVRLLKDIASILPNVEVVLDCPSSKALSYVNRYVKKTGNESARIYFFVDDEENFAKQTNARLLSSQTFYRQTRSVLHKGLNLYTKIAMRVVDRKRLGLVIHLRLLGHA